MSTRGLFGFCIDNELKLEFRGHDAYPDGLGKEVQEFIIRFESELHTIAKNLILVDGRTAEDLGVNTEQEVHLNDWGLSKEKYIVDASEFMKDGLYCTWTYIINVDTNHLDVYFHGNNLLHSINFDKIDLFDMNILKEMANNEYGE